MVVAGQLGTLMDNITADIELISPYPSLNPVPECLVDLNPFTFGNLYKSVGSAVAPDGLPLMCGGKIAVDNGLGNWSVTKTDKCWMYIPSSDKWEETAGTLLAASEGFASDYKESFGFALVDVPDCGGCDEPLQVTNDNGVTFEQLSLGLNSIHRILKKFFTKKLQN